ncbi:helix-turn-helix domain-containing protein [Devosia naphthalenivorans]|uniref:helix-turn-helix transcriptional regulator n=1 Tax=Devosia naphthalenivorans TaxID=2082392 RepID=UPI000D339744
MSAAATVHRASLGARIRAARGVLGWSQVDLADRIGSTQRSVHRIEQGAVDARSSTVAAIDQAFRDAGLTFEDLGEGGFKLIAPSSVFVSKGE